MDGLSGSFGAPHSFMIWFIAIGAVIVRGAVADATWDQSKGRS